MARYELTLDPDYVSHWSVVDALRELFQNVLDESSLTPENSMDVSRQDDILRISTKNASLSKSTLLIGNSSKRDDDSTIGNQGEGYKLGLLVLLRLGHSVKIHNYSEKELWIPKIIKSKQFKSRLMVIDTEKYIWKAVPDNDLTFEISGITDEIYSNLQKTVLQLRDNATEIIESDLGNVLLDESEAGKIYVNGLYVTTSSENFKYGYDIKPQYLKLDRDRRAVDSFELSWQTGLIWGKIADIDKIMDMLDTGMKDVQYVHNIMELDDKTFEKFNEEYGENAIPVTNQIDVDHITSIYSNVNPIIVPEKKRDLIISSLDYNLREHTLETIECGMSPSDILSEFYEQYSYRLCVNGQEKLSQIIELSLDWK